MRNRILGLVLAVTFALALHAPIAASADVGDSATGTGTTTLCGGIQGFDFAAVGGVGTAATGTFEYSCDFSNPSVPDSYFIGVINCLVTDGDRAYLAGTITESSFSTGAVGRELGVVITDSDAGPTPSAADTLSNYYFDFPCEYPVENYTLPTTSGDLVVTDATPPAVGPVTKDDCKKGGYLSYPALEFKNQGACVSYVQQLERIGS